MPKTEPSPAQPDSLTSADRSRKAGKLTPDDQRRRFEEAARELGCEDGEALDAAFGKIVPPKLPSTGTA